ncbi:hypothetical protein [Nocardiopsis rhodophaea]|uniref:hypothetical protein n=1 Tax=Nocardiopsis rhodophaea TaxID=280238 RepID=UPI0031D397E0
MADRVRRINSAPTARRQAREQRPWADEDAHASETFAQRIADELKAQGSAVIAAADDAQRESARKAGRRAGRILGRSVRTMVLSDGRVAVWEHDRHANPLQARLDEQRATRILDEAYRRNGPLLPDLSDGGPR